MNTIQINKNELINAIKENCHKFGDSFLGLYVDVEGNVECTDLQRSGDSTLILGFNGMGEYTDSNGLYSDDEHYDAKSVAEYIVQNQECLEFLEFGGTILEDDGTKTNYEFNIYDKSKMTIENVLMSDFDETTVLVLANGSNNNSETFYIQTVDNEYRSDLGCWIMTDSSNGDINPYDYPQFDIDKIISAAQKYIQSMRVEKHTDYIINNESVYLIIKSYGVDIVTRNSEFINSDTSSYQREFSDTIMTFESEEEANEYLNGL